LGLRLILLTIIDISLTHTHTMYHELRKGRVLFVRSFFTENKLIDCYIYSVTDIYYYY